MSKLKVNKFIINGKFIGSYLVLIDDQRIYPIYVLNQNYVRFNHNLVNIDQLISSLDHQDFFTITLYIKTKAGNQTKLIYLLNMSFLYTIYTMIKIINRKTHKHNNNPKRMKRKERSQTSQYL